jgi:hypothetical protein
MTSGDVLVYGATGALGDGLRCRGGRGLDAAGDDGIVVITRTAIRP